MLLEKRKNFYTFVETLSLLNFYMKRKTPENTKEKEDIEKVELSPEEKLEALKNKEMTKIFIKKIKKQKDKFMDALLRCNALEDQASAETLRGAISAISNTIAALTQKTATLSDLKRFHIKVDLVAEDDDEGDSTIVKLELKQKERSHPLPLNHYIEIRPPIIEKVKTKLIKERSNNMRYETTFDFGPKTEATIQTIATSDLEFDIMKVSNVLGKRKVQLVALATAPMSQLTFAQSSTVPLLFMNIDGSKTSFLFDVVMTVDRPLAPVEDLHIDENIAVIP